MATLTFNYTDGDDNQIWLKGKGSAGQAWSPTISGVPSGAIIDSVTLTFTTGNSYNSPGRTDVYWGTSNDVTTGANIRIWYVSGTGGGKSFSVDLSPYITGNMTATLYFYKSANGSSSQSNVYFSNISITVNYTIPYTNPTAPTSVTISPTTAAPGGSATLSWSGASAGNSNPIAGYHIYRADSADGTYSHTYSVITTSTSGSITVTAPSTNGSSYYFKVYTIGTVTDYNSSASSYASLTCSYSAPSAPTNVRISKCISTGENATLSWNEGSSGTNNPIAGYHIYYRDSSNGINWGNETLYADAGNVASYSVSPPAVGYYRKYVVYSIGTVSGSNSSGTVCYGSVYHYNGAFTDDPLVAGETHIKAVHMTELQELARIICACYDYFDISFNSVTAGVTSIGNWSQHVGEIRQAIDNLGISHENWIEISENRPSVSVMAQLRNVLMGI